MHLRTITANELALGRHVLYRCLIIEILMHMHIWSWVYRREKTDIRG